MRIQMDFSRQVKIGTRLMLFVALFAMLVMSGVSAVRAQVTTSPVTLTVLDTNSAPQAGLNVYAFSGVTYTGLSGSTDAGGQFIFNLPDGSYNFRADLNGTQFFSGGASGVDTCTLPGCTVDSVTVTLPVVVTVVDTNSAPQAGLSVYAFNGASYTGQSGVSDAGGQVSFTLVPGDYNFRADLNGTQFFSGGASGVNTCTVPGCTSDSVAVTLPVVVTVVDNSSTPQGAGIPVYAFNGTTYTGQNSLTDAGGQVTFTLLPGDYNFRADVNSTQFFSGGASGVNTCTIPGCTSDSVTVTAAPVVVTVTDDSLTPVPQSGLPVFVYDGDTYAGFNGTTDGAGQVSFTLPAGSYRFRADLNGTQFFSGAANHCSVPGCTSAAVTVTTPVVVTVSDTNSNPQAGIAVFAYSGTTYTGESATTDVNGQAAFTLVPGDYNFRADLNGTQFFSGGSSGVNTCTVSGCTSDTVILTGPVLVTVQDTNSVPQAGLPVYAYSGATYTGKSGTTNASGQVSFTLVPGDYRFRADLNSTQFFSGAADTCSIPSVGVNCTSDLVVVTIPAVVTVQDTYSTPQPGVPVYAFSGSTYTGKSGITGAGGQVSFTLLPGSYNFRADVGASQYFSGGSSGVNSCTIPGCTADAITVPASAPPPSSLPAATCSLVGTTRTCDLWAKAGTLTLPDSSTLPFWGYADSAGGAAQLPGPMIIANQNETLVINLHNDLSEATGLLFQGQSLAPDTTGVGSGGVKSYSFVAGQPGTTLYEAGLLANAQHQVAMGLYGAVIVRPSGAPGQAYASAASAFDHEALVLLSEIDPALNTSANPAAFDMRSYKPAYALINGEPFPNTANIYTTAGSRVLLRYLNAGLLNHSMGLLGLGQTVLGLDGSPLAHAYRMVAETIAPGQTQDAVAVVPASAAQGAKFALFDGSLGLHNSNTAGYGGMLTFLLVGAPPVSGPDVVGPATSAVSVTPNPTDGSVNIVLSATTSDLGNGGANIQAAQYYIDDTSGAPIAMAATDGSFDSPTEVVSATITAATLSGLPSGTHTFYVRGQDALGNWGSFNFVVLNLDKNPPGNFGGPKSTGLTLKPNPSNGSSDVAFNATGDDTTTGNNNIAAAEFTVDGGPATAMTVNVSAPIASLDYTLPAAYVAGLSEGVHTVAVRSQDALGNWGAYAAIDLRVDKTGPNTNSVSVAPTPNNGLQGVNSNTAAVRVTAAMADPIASAVNSALGTAEGFIDTIGADGTGFPLVASDAVFDSSAESAYADIPLGNLALLSEGTHTIYVHTRDASGNWGATSSTTLLLDRTPPAISALSATPNPTRGATSVSLSATATEALTGVAQAEWFVGADPGPGLANAMAVSGGGPYALSATINVSTWAVGEYSLSVRARDGAGNWSASSTVILTVGSPLYFSTSGNSNPPTVGGTADDADIYYWNGSAFSRYIDASSAPYNLPASGGGNANVDGYQRVDATHFYMSFTGQVNVPGIGNVQDEDVVYFNAGTWSLYFDGSAFGLGAGGAASFDLDAFSIVGGTLYFSTDNNNIPPGAGGTGDDADIYQWNGGSSYTRVWDASGAGLATTANVNGLTLVDSTHFYLSFSAVNTSVPSLGNVQDEDVVYYNAGAWSVYFDGTAFGLTNNNHNLDAISVP